MSACWRSRASVETRSKWSKFMLVILRSLWTDRSAICDKAGVSMDTPARLLRLLAMFSDAPVVERRRARRAARDHDPHASPRRHPAARPRLSDHQHDRPLRRLRARRRGAAPAPAARRRRGDRRVGRAPRAVRGGRPDARRGGAVGVDQAPSGAARRRCAIVSTRSARSWSVSPRTAARERAGDGRSSSPSLMTLAMCCRRAERVKFTYRDGRRPGQPSGASSRTGWCRSGGVGTSSVSTSTATTGARTASTASRARRRPVTATRRAIPPTPRPR